MEGWALGAACSEVFAAASPTLAVYHSDCRCQACVPPRPAQRLCVACSPRRWGLTEGEQLVRGQKLVLDLERWRSNGDSVAV